LKAARSTLDPSMTKSILRIGSTPRAGGERNARELLAAISLLGNLSKGGIKFRPRQREYGQFTDS
jgi:hypothetical protein